MIGKLGSVADVLSRIVVPGLYAQSDQFVPNTVKIDDYLSRDVILHKLQQKFFYSTAIQNDLHHQKGDKNYI